MEPSREQARDHTGTAADEGFHPPALVRVGGAAPLASWWAAVAIGALVLLVVKPWGSDETGAPSPLPRASAPSVTLAPVSPSEPPRSPDEVIAADCRAPSGWRIYTVERWHDQTLRIWWAIAPLVTSDPSDPRIPVLSIVAPNVPALGYCAPLFGPDRPLAGTLVRMWQTGAGGSIREIRTRRLQPPFETPLLALYAPPGVEGDRLDPLASWPTGRYLFSSEDRWFGVDLRIEPEGVAPRATGSDSRPLNASTAP